MSYVIITPEQMQTSRWSGGSTTQMMIFPAGSSYRNRDFRFRISSAAVEDAVSVFTKLDGVERFLTVLEGKISLRTGVSEPQELNAYDCIEISETALLFVPLCGERFAWEDLKDD
mgnify:CR=1 FL=1